MDLLGCEAIVAERPRSAYTPAMTLNKAAFLALVGMILATILLVVGFIGDVFGVVRGLIPAMRLWTSLHLCLRWSEYGDVSVRFSQSALLSGC